jgi:tRNA 2-thiouridine synthesizing protein A
MSAATPPVVDARGKACPVPVIDLASAVEDVAPGEHVVLLADDPGAKVDIPVWCRMKRHDLVAVEELGSAWRFTVRRVS